MSKFTILVLIYFVGISALLIINEISYRKLGLKGEISRKIAHLTATLATVPFPFLFNSHWYVLILAIIFFLVLFVTKNNTQLNSIHDINRSSIGSYMLPISIYLTFLLYTFLDSSIYYILPMLVLAISDPLAGILGMSINKYNRHIHIGSYRMNKTYVGSGAFFISSFLIAFTTFHYYNESLEISLVFGSLLLAIAGTAFELLSWKGSDNLTIPIGVALSLYFLL